MNGIARVTATPDQVFEGYTVGSGAKAACTGCQRTVRDGDPVGISAYQTSEGARWDIARLFCVDCRKSSIQYPTTSATSVVLQAHLCVTSDAATQSVRLTLHDIQTMQLSPSEDGGER